MTDPPAGTGPLRLELALQGAGAEVSPEGAQWVLNESGRNLNYNRLRVTDATARELAAWMELISPTILAVVVEDPVSVEAQVPFFLSSSGGGRPQFVLALMSATRMTARPMPRCRRAGVVRLVEVERPCHARRSTPTLDS